MFKKIEYHIKENIDRMKLKKYISNKIKRDLIEITNKLAEECPSLNLKFNAEDLDHDLLASRLLEILMYLETTHPDNYLKCINILSEVEKEKDSKSSTPLRIKQEIDKFHIIEAIKIIPFVPDDICKHLFELLSKDQDITKQWDSNRHFLGFRAFLATNEISIPLALEELLYNNLFKSNKIQDYGEATLIAYGRYQLDIWEEDLKAILSELSIEDVDMIFSLHLIYQWIVLILEKRNEKISYSYDDIPLLKRVILAQYSKFIEGVKCTDEDLNNLAIKINNILYSQINDSCIKILPWGDLD